MDWHAWLSKSCLHPSLAHEYGHLFFTNELEEEDIKSLDHEFLQSMGITVGKHRLEILKLARKERKGIMVSAVKRFRKRLCKYVQMLTQSSSSAIVAVPKVVGGEWKVSTVTSKRRLQAEKQGRLMITSGKVATHASSKEGSGGANTEVRWDSMFKDLKPT